MKEITLNSKGKINLLLDVTARRENGYHDIVTIMQSVSLSDTVTVEKTEDGIIYIESDFDNIVSPEDNIVYKALKLMKEEYCLKEGFRAIIKKNIPIAGGMGGGSTNAAAAIKAVNILCDLSEPMEKLMKVGVRLGADVPFCIHEKCAICRGVGDEITETVGLSNVKIVIVNPKTFVSTKEIYELVDEKCKLGKIDENAAIDALKNSKLSEYKNVLKNIMQPVTAEICPQIEEIVRGLRELGALHSMMSGSGPTCFGIFDKDIDEKIVKERFKDYFVVVTEPTA